MSILDRFKKLFVDELKMNQTEIAKIFGITPQAVSKWLRGHAQISLAYQHMVVNKVENLNKDWWFEGKGPIWHSKPGPAPLMELQEPEVGYGIQSKVIERGGDKASAQTDLESIMVMLARVYAELSVLNQKVATLEASLKQERTQNRELLTQNRELINRLSGSTPKAPE
jgi:transcriptional regulator with XRE-family HTH domain